MKNLMLMLIPALLSTTTLLQQPASEPDWLPDIEVVGAESDPVAPAIAPAIDEAPSLVVSPVAEEPAPAPAPEPIPEDSIPHLTRDDLQCVDDNMAKLLASAEAQNAILNNLTSDLAAKLAEANKTALTCSCNCPTAEEIADAVEARLRPLLVVKNESTGSVRKIPASPDSPFELSPGEILKGYERIPGSGVIEPVRNLGAVAVPGVSQSVNRYSLDGWEVRTAQQANGGTVGQVRQAVRQTCMQVWNPATRRYERQCTQQ